MTDQENDENAPVFGSYAELYDTYYSEKNYAAEVEFVLGLATRFADAPQTVLDMGCGTGRHLEQFVSRGLNGDGFDMSDTMLKHAEERLAGKADCSVQVGDLRTFRNGTRYDLVVSMFAVMGYLTDNVDLIAGLRTAAQHLTPEGLFVFDGWFGSAVLAEKPETREHVYTEGAKTITRRAQPEHDAVKQQVQINYTIDVVEAGEKHTFREQHTMRYLFVQETALALELAGMELVYHCPFLEPDGTLDTSTWNACFVARLRSESVNGATSAD
jgi:SAM-dependent methyltransferase